MPTENEMTDVPHALGNDFPEFADRIDAMRQDNSEFAKLADEYEEINQAVYKAEAEIEPTDDIHLEDLRKKRVWLKDQLYALLNA